MSSSSLIDTIIINIITQYGQIKSSTLFHILTGKRTAFVLYDTYKHQVDRYYACLPFLKKYELEQVLSSLQSKKLIDQCDEHFFICQPIEQNSSTITLAEHLNPTILTLWTRKAILELKTSWQLLMQIVSYKQFNQVLTTPITDHVLIQQNCKKWLQEQLNNTAFEYNQIAEEFLKICQLQDNTHNLIILSTLTNHQFHGITTQRLAHHLNCTIEEYDILETLSWKVFFENILKYQKQAPYLFSWFDFHSRKIALSSQSAMETFLLIQKQYSLDKISIIRRLKMSTIHEHIIELALVLPDFNFDIFLKEQVEIIDKKQGDILKLNFASFKQLYTPNQEISFLHYRLLQIREIKRKRGTYDH